MTTGRRIRACVTAPRSECFDALVKDFDEFDYLTRAEVSSAVDGKENFDTNHAPDTTWRSRRR